MFQPRTTAVLGSYVLADINGVQTVLRDHWVLIEGRRIAPREVVHGNFPLLYGRPLARFPDHSPAQ